MVFCAGKDARKWPTALDAICLSGVGKAVRRRVRDHGGRRLRSSWAGTEALAAKAFPCVCSAQAASGWQCGTGTKRWAGQPAAAGWKPLPLRASFIKGPAGLKELPVVSDSVQLQFRPVGLRPST